MSTDYKSNICIFHITWTCLFLSCSCLRGGVWGMSLLWLAWQEDRNADLRRSSTFSQGLILSPIDAETQFYFTARARMMPVRYTRYSFINQKSFWFIHKEYRLCLSGNYLGLLLHFNYFKMVLIS